jgi:hypothetical protein
LLILTATEPLPPYAVALTPLTTWISEYPPSDVSYGSVLRARNRCQDRQRKGRHHQVFHLWFPPLSTSFSCLALQAISFENLRARLDSHRSQERQLRV